MTVDLKRLRQKVGLVEHFDWIVKSSPTIIVRWEYYRELSASDKTLRKIRF